MRAVLFSKIFWKEKEFKSSDKAGRLHGAFAFIFTKGHIAMENFNKIVESIGAMAEISAIYYHSLIKAGLPHDCAITLTAKMIGEIFKLCTGEEEKHE